MKNKFLKIILKILYPLEFIISIIFVYLIYKIMFIKSYDGYYSKYLIILFIPICITLISIIILNCIKNNKKIEKIFLGFIIPIGLFYLVFIEPTYIPDENAHLWKSYEISQGQIITPIDNNGKSHTNIPKFFADTNVNYGNYKNLNTLISQETNYDDTISVVCPAQNYNPILYIFSSIGLSIGKILGLNGLLIQYIARILNYIVFLLLSYFSIKKIPFGKLCLSIYYFMPMFLQQAISISADSLINSILLFFISYNLFLYFKKEKISNVEILLYIIISIFIGIAKFVYLPLVGISLFFIFKKDMDKKYKIIMIVFSIILATITAFLWYIFSMKYSANEIYLSSNNINSIEQIKSILLNPIHGLKVILKTVLLNGDFYLYSMIGSSLGWLNINIPIIKILGFILILILSIFFEKNDISLSVKQRLWLLFITIVSTFLIFIALYIGWTGVGKDTVEGIQGRYFIPVMFLPLICCCMKQNYIKIKNIHIYIMIIACLLNLSVISNIYNFFV